MNSSQFVTNLAFKFHEPLEIELIDFDGNKRQTGNLKIVELKNYIDNTFVDRDLTELYNLISVQFKPTSQCPYPLPVHVKEIWDNNNRVINQQPQEMIDFNEVVWKYGQREDIPRECPEEFKNKTINELIKEDNKTHPSDMLKKYSIKKCGEIWTREGELKYLNGDI